MHKVQCCYAKLNLLPIGQRDYLPTIEFRRSHPPPRLWRIRSAFTSSRSLTEPYDTRRTSSPGGCCLLWLSQLHFSMFRLAPDGARSMLGLVKLDPDDAKTAVEIDFISN
jgi:hypothetical protein